MLVLSRQRDETIMIGDEIELTVVDIRGDKVRLGIKAPCEVPVHRKEVYEAIRQENEQASRLGDREVRALRPLGKANPASIKEDCHGSDQQQHPLAHRAGQPGAVQLRPRPAAAAALDRTPDQPRRG